jgi:hypothetical protein
MLPVLDESGVVKLSSRRWLNRFEYGASRRPSAAASSASARCS